MTTIKFDKAVKYEGIRYAAHEAFQVADEDVEQLKEAGATVLAVEPVTPPVEEPVSGEDIEQSEEPVSGEDIAQLKEALLEYTVAELVKFAEEHSIDLQKKTKKAEIYNIIIASLN